MYKSLVFGLLIVMIGVSLFLLYRKNLRNRHKSTAPTSEPSTTPTPRPTIPNMKMVPL